jgi:hypothetical protein
MENHLMKILLKQKPGILFSGVALLLVMIRAGDVLIANPKSSKENSEPSPEIN